MNVVAAAWLEGADGRGMVDEHSDIDLVVAVEDGAGDRVFDAVEHALSRIAEVDHSYDEPGGAPGLQHRVYHLTGTRPSLLIDLVLQPRSRQFAFDPDHPDEVPRPLFDKTGVIRFDPPESSAFREQCARAWQDAKQRFLPEARVLRYVERGLYLEGMAAYQKYVLAPMVELLRLKHAPRTSGYGLVHVSEHLPADAVSRLETLHRVGSSAELGRKLLEARDWLDEILEDGEPSYDAGQPAPSHSS